MWPFRKPEFRRPDPNRFQSERDFTVSRRSFFFFGASAGIGLLLPKLPEQLSTYTLKSVVEPVEYKYEVIFRTPFGFTSRDDSIQLSTGEVMRITGVSDNGLYTVERNLERNPQR